MDWNNRRDQTDALPQALERGSEFALERVEQGSEDGGRSTRLLLLALALSLILHGGLLLSLFRFGLDTDPAPVTPQFVSIKLVPDNPLRAEPTREEVVEEISNDLAEPEPDIESVAEAVPPPEESPPQTVPSTELASEPPAQPPLSEAQPQSSRPAAPAIRLPSVDLVKSSLQSMEQQRRSQLWLRDCTRRQEESDLLDCDSEPEVDYSAATRNATYRALNPVREVSRAQGNLPTVAANVDVLGERLQQGNLVDGLADYLLRETEAAITLYSNPGNRAVDNIIQMTDKSAAAAQARQVLGDAWVTTRSRQLQQRKVVER